MLCSRCVAAFVAVLAFSLSSAFGQSKADGNEGVSQTSKAAVATAADDGDADSADIPPFARGKISPEQYLLLRDEQIKALRGIDDLTRNPQMRSNAIRNMQLQEQFYRNFTFTLQSGATGAAAVPAWTELGPDPIPNGQTGTLEVPVSGRVTAIAIDPTNENIVYVAAAQGGVYRTLDGGTTWTALMDQAQSLSIGAITIDPLNHNTVFVGTGEGNFAIDSFFGVGLYVIRNASTTADLSGPFNLSTDAVPVDVFTGRSITKILVNPANDSQIMLSTASGFSGLSSDTFSTLPTRGVYVSQNALAANPQFTRLTIQTPTLNQSVTDIEMDPGDSTRIVVNVFGSPAVPEDGVWVSTSGDPWANPSTAVWTHEITASQIGKFAVNHSGAPAATTFFLTFDENVTCGAVQGQGTLRKSVDRGITWTPLAAAQGFCGGQCFYDEPVAVHPQNVNTLFLGGNFDSGSLAACGSSTVAKSIDGGTTFARSGTSLHPDSHVIAFAPSNPTVMYTGNDGGIFRSADGGATWTSVNRAGFRATQFQSISVHASDPNFTIGGTQDNGTEFMKPDGSWTRADFGDGGYSAIDQSSTSTTTVTLYHTYFNQTGTQIGFARVGAANATEGSWGFFGCGAGATPNGINCADTVRFYAPMALGSGAPNNVYFGTDRLYRSIDQGATMSLASQAPITANVPVTAIGIAPEDDNVRIVGLQNGSVFATTTASTALINVTGGWGTHYVARTAVDPVTSTTAYVTLDGYGLVGGHVWKTTNLSPTGTTWTAVSAGLPDVPVNAFAIDAFNPSYLYAGTDIGVFNSTDGGTTWAPYGTGLPRVAVFDLNIQKSAHKVRIGTHGRGAWEIAASTFANTISNAVNNASPALGSTVTFTATVNKGTGVPVPTGTVTFSDGTTVLGTGPLNASGVATFSTTSLGLGPHSVSAAYGGDTLYAASNSAAVVVTVVTVGTTATTTGLGASASNPVLGASITLTATVNKGTGTATPTGNVTFSEGATVLGTGALNASAVATLQTSALAVGAHNITASYSGDATYSASTSAPVTVTVLPPPDYAVSTPTGTATVTAGQPATYTITITPSGGFNTAVNFACSGLPAQTSCTFNPTSVIPNGAAASTTLTITTTARGAASPATNLGAGLITGGSFFALALVFGLTDKKRRLHVLCMGLVVAGLLGAMVACGGGGGNPSPTPTPISGTPAGTFNVTVSATSGSIAHSSVITLVVR
jgi:photosystem II stability/assembly factor-like uncharacterized protein